MGDGVVPERLLPGLGRAPDSGGARIYAHPPLRLRQGIETLFGALKSRGFNLEDTRLQDPERLSKLLALLALAFTWAFVVGQWQASVKELKLKKHGYPAKSIFRLGLSILCRLLTNFEHFDLVVWTKVIKLLSCS